MALATGTALKSKGKRGSLKESTFKAKGTLGGGGPTATYVKEDQKLQTLKNQRRIGDAIWPAYVAEFGDSIVYGSEQAGNAATLNDLIAYEKNLLEIDKKQERNAGTIAESAAERRLRLAKIVGRKRRKPKGRVKEL
jgi:hypothetical protein